MFLLPRQRSTHNKAHKTQTSERLFVGCVLLFVFVFAGEVCAQSAKDGFDPGANSSIFAVAVQFDGKIVVGGQFTSIGGGGFGNTFRSRIARLNMDGTLDTSFDPGASPNHVSALAIQPDGKILVAGDFSVLGGGGFGKIPRSRIGRLNEDGTIDPTFNPGANGLIQTLVLQPDGKILIGGFFTMVGGGGTGSTPRNRIARLNPDGTVDPAFNPGANSTVTALALQKDQKILVTGAFTNLGGAQRRSIGRLNSDGTLDPSFNPGANNSIRTVAVQADGKIVVGGDFTALGGGTGITTRNFIGRLNPNGTVDIAFNPGADFFVSVVALQLDGSILVGGLFNTLGGGSVGVNSRNHIGRLRPDGSIDPDFNPGTSGLPHVIAFQFDRKIIIGGAFSTFGGLSNGRANIVRLYPDGSVESTLNVTPNGPVFAVAIQGDGKILIGGSFTTVNGVAHRCIARINPSGSLDQSFQPQVLGGSLNGVVQSIAVQPDGKILIGGDFSSLDDGGPTQPTRNNIARLNSNGTVDTTFDPGANNLVRSLSIQADGKILVGGLFTALGGGAVTSRSRIGRLNANGTVDSSFDPGVNGDVNAIALLPDGKILVGGNFDMIGGGGTGSTPRNFLARLNSNGAVDAAFDPGANGPVNAFAINFDQKILVAGAFSTLGGGGFGTTTRNGVGRLTPEGDLDGTYVSGADGLVQSIALQADGKLIVGGSFTSLGVGPGTQNRNRIGRFNLDGSVDASFDPGANRDVTSLALQPDGKVVVGGGFLTLGGGGLGIDNRTSIGRLTNTDPAFQFVSVHSLGTAVAWSNLGSSPQVTRVVFESSTNGVNFTFLGAGVPPPAQSVTVAWFLQGLSLPFNQRLFIRARAFYHTGQETGSYSMIQVVNDTLLCPTVTVSPGSGNLSDGVAGIAYSQQFTQSGGTGSISFTKSAGVLPAGLSLNSSTGLLSGAPTQTGTFEFAIQATDQNGCFGTSVYSLTINCPTITLSPIFGPIGNGTAGTSYSQQFTQTGGIGTITFRISSGTLPAGLTFNSSGLLSGTPTETGTFLFTVQAMDQNGCVGTSTYLLRIECPAIVVSPTNSTLPIAVAGSFYSQTFTQSGGIGAIMFSTRTTTPPAGLTFSSDGVLSGTPTQVGTFFIDVFALDSNGCGGVRNYKIEIVSGVRLSAAAVSVGENVNSITLNALRSGDTSGAITVNFATSDTAGLTSCTVANGKASERCDYGTTAGTLRFAAGETSKSFVIPIVNDALVEGNETFTVTLSGATGVTIGGPQTTTVTIVDNDTTPATQNPIDGVEFFVTQQYIDFLGRLPDSVGFANWVATLGGCPNGGFGENLNPHCDRVHVSSGFFLSEEFRGRGYFAYRFYEVALNRRPTYAEFIPDMAQVGGAQSPESEMLSKAAYTLEFTQRPEFKSRYDALSNSAYVNALEANAEVPLFNKGALIAALDANDISRANVLRDVVENTAVADRFFNRAFVAMQYFGYLRRDPDAVGFQNWVNTLNANPANFRHMIFGFLFSTEYRQRFGP